ncbi:MAG TPA: DUF3891 family protein [Gemmatimonadaceae bacterium]|nr:DUF3891 family protein [Gemmatimonadaceae bacterium]
MIIHQRGASVLLITQPDHAALAARIMRRWQYDDLARSPRRDEILFALEHHDDGWLDVDSAPLVDATNGALLDFISAPESVRRGIWPRGVARLAESPYAAALVAQHALHIYRRCRDDTAWQFFFDEMETLRAQHLRAAAPATLDALLRDYRWVRTGDLLSLVFCNGWTDVQIDERGGSARLLDDRLVLTPDPFAGESVPLAVTGREMPTATFDSEEDARAAYARAPAATLSGVAAGA